MTHYGRYIQEFNGWRRIQPLDISLLGVSRGLIVFFEKESTVEMWGSLVIQSLGEEMEISKVLALVVVSS